MLLTDIKNCYLNNKEVSELWLGGNKIWTLSSEPVGDNPFDLYTAAEIQTMIQNGTVEQYFKIGDTVTCNGTVTKSLTGLDSVTFMIVDFEYAGEPTMVLMSLADFGEVSWYSSDTSSIKSYTSSKPYQEAGKLASCLDDSDLKSIMVRRSFRYISGKTSSSSTTLTFAVPSLTEIAGVGHGMSYQEYGTQLRYFREGGTFAFPNWCWTRERDSYYSGRIQTFYKLGGYSDESAISTSYKAYTTTLVFLG